MQLKLMKPTSIDVQVEKYNEFVKFLNMSEEDQDEYTKSF